MHKGKDKAKQKSKIEIDYEGIQKCGDLLTGASGYVYKKNLSAPDHRSSITANRNSKESYEKAQELLNTLSGGLLSEGELLREVEAQYQEDDKSVQEMLQDAIG